MHTRSNDDFIIGSFYYPPNFPSTVFDELAQNLDDIKERYPHSKIIIAGDFNCPGIDWEHGLSLTDTYTSRILREKLLSVSQDFQLSQIVTFPTRGMNTLDLCFTSHPNIILNCDSIPGFSDHDAILATLSISYYQPKQEPRKIPLYRKANWDLIRGELSDLSNEYFNINSILVRTVDKNWSFFLANFQNIINDIVPFRTICQHTRPLG